MARVSLIDATSHPELVELIERLRQGRGGKLINLYRLLLHSPEIVPAWFEYSNAIRWKASLDGRLRELAIVRVALIYDVGYMLNQHVPALTTPEGIDPSECDALIHWREATCFTERERAMLAYADSVSTDVDVPDDVFEELSVHFDERQIVELTVLISAFNMSARLMKALKIDPEPSHSDPAAILAKRSNDAKRWHSLSQPTLVVEDDWFTRMIEIVLDPNASAERCAAFNDFFSHDEPNFRGYCERLRRDVGGLFRRG